MNGTSHAADFDVVIGGGGLVGATLALALAELDLRVALIEASAFDDPGQPSFDDRTTALSNGSRRAFEALGVWQLIEHEATPIRRIHVSDQGRFGFARLDAHELGLKALGYVVTNRIMGAALWRRLAATSVHLIAPARLAGMELIDGAQRVSFVRAGDGNETESVSAKLVVAADGAQSTLRTAAGVSAQSWDYEQVAVIANVYTQRFHDHVAYERFTSAGPIAMLPITDGRCGLIWTFAKDEADRWAECPDEEFLARLQEAFGFRLGRITRVGTRHKYPLALTRSDDHIAERLAIVGNAAQALHPIAGQGFNLGLRDAASLAEILAEAREQTSGELDVGDGLWLQRYRAWREADRSNIVRFTDGLVRLFTQPFGPVQVLRDFGLLAFDLVTPAKHALAQLSLGAAGRVPRLTRGVPLRHAH
jgi:2-octaprenyl-6-methoxyphenol hydroxylase